MSDEEKPKPWQVPPPVDRIRYWFRIVLWLLPTGFFIFSFWVADRLKQLGIEVPFPIAIFILANVGFTIGTGYYQAHLSGGAHLEPGGIADRVMLFVCYQLLFVPLIVGFTLFAACVIDPLKF